ncbi:anti-sigma factor [Scytonema millei]|uniref:Anti-sigma factor n=1 Tax=Scytonema millei VB511283 TaxID=1245923 RepID=A0A9X5E9G5_9CYAN|nr:anti-sigma factor [Scytonema millei]NHC37401.1 anti-sigma factor [Scytonema millei VB511283]
MNESSDRERIKALAAGFVADDLTPEEAEEFRQLLVNNPELVQEIDDLQEVLRQLLDGFTEVEAPPHLLPNILNQAEAAGSRMAAIERSGRSWRRIAGSLAALFVVALGFDNYRLRQELGQAHAVSTLLQNAETRLFTFQGVNSLDTASGSIIMNPEQQKVVMLVQNLPAPPPGQVYLLWAIVDNKKLPCGEVKPYAWGDSTSRLPFTPEMYRDFYHPQFSGLVVTLETDRNSARPTGPVVMQSSQI